MRTPFIKVHMDIEAERTKHLGMEFEMNKQMLDKYIKQLLNLRYYTSKINQDSQIL